MDSIICLPLGALAANCYIIPGEGKSAVVIDPASTGEIIAELDTEELTLGGIILTHGHYDHFAGAAALKARTGAPIYAPDLDREMLGSADKSWARFMDGEEFQPVVPDHAFSDGEGFSVCGVDFRVMGAPGHTGGSCLLFCDKWRVIFTGDVLFKNSIGRTDGFSGNDRMMVESLMKISRIEGDYTILPGHGDATNLAFEKKNNPYLRMI